LSAGGKKDKNLDVVAVGYAIRDNELPHELASIMDTRPGSQLTWVVPEAFRATREADPAPHSIGRACLLAGTKKQATIPIPMRAIDFFYDLWEAYCEEKAASGRP
jgi:hypothetical protein